MLNLVIRGKDLIIQPDIKEIQIVKKEYKSNYYQDWFYYERWNWYQILEYLLEDYLCNGWEILDPAITGDLTEAFMITDSFSVWADLDYQTQNLLDVVLNQEKEYKLTYIRPMTDDQSRYNQD